MLAHLECMQQLADLLHLQGANYLVTALDAGIAFPEQLLSQGARTLCGGACCSSNQVTLPGVRCLHTESCTLLKRPL